MPSFDVSAALKAGYTEQEIAAHMQSRGLTQSTQRLKDIIGKGPEAQGQDLMAGLSGHEKYPSSEAEAGKQLGQTTAKYGAAVAPMYIPGPGKGNLLGQVLKGAAIGGAVGGVERGVTQATQGHLPDMSTLKAAGTGAAIGGALGPLSEIPEVGRYARSTKLGKMILPAAEEAATAAPGAAAGAEDATLAQQVMRGGTSSAGQGVSSGTEATPSATMQVGSTPTPKPNLADQVNQQVLKEQALRDARIAAGIKQAPEAEVNISGYRQPKTSSAAPGAPGAVVSTGSKAAAPSGKALETASGIVSPAKAAEIAGRNSAALGQGGTYVDWPADQRRLVQKLIEKGLVPGGK